MKSEERFVHRKLAGGIEFAALPLPGRHIAAYEIRVFAGLSNEPADLGGLARVVEDSISKGTEQRSAQDMTDAFDAMGAQTGSGVGRESMVFRCTCLPEYVEHALGLHAEMLRTPSFPDEYVEVAVELSKQELSSLEDDPGDLARKLIGPHAFGEVMGRHELGTEESLSRINRDTVTQYWQSCFAASRMQIVIGGEIDVEKTAARIDQLFGGFGSAASSNGTTATQFSPGKRHQHKELEQEHILICWPGVPVDHDDYPTQRITLGVLGEGMSSRLFAEVREKQGLVYWVGAWDEHPRGAGRLFMGASTTPARCDQTYRTLLREVDRLSEDVSEEEIERTKVGIIAKTQTHGDITRARVSELSSEISYSGRPVPLAEQNAKLTAVTIADVKEYLHAHPRTDLCVQTLGPRALEGVQ